MKKILQISVLTFFALHSVALNCSSWKTTAEEKQSDSTCQILHTIFDTVQNNENPFTIIVKIAQPWAEHDLKKCMKKYESIHPESSKKLPAKIELRGSQLKVTILPSSDDSWSL